MMTGENQITQEEASWKERSRFLRRDVKKLGEILGRVLQECEGEDFFQKIESIRELAKAERAGKAGDGLDEQLSALSSAELAPIARAFSTFLGLVNFAEQQERMRRRERSLGDPVNSPPSHSVAAKVRHLLKSSPGETKGGKSASPACRLNDKGELLRALKRLEIDIVFTAHPTEVVRRTHYDRFEEMQSALSLWDREATETPPPRVEKVLKRSVKGIWLTEEFRRFKPTPAEEARLGTVTVEKSLWNALGDFLDQLDDVYLMLGEKRPVDCVPFRFSSWMGGDRDGNPFVTVAMTERILSLNYWKMCELIELDLKRLSSELSMSKCGSLMAEIDADAVNNITPYRKVIRDLRNQLEGLRNRLTEKMKLPDSLGHLTEERDGLLHARKTLRLIYDDLCQAGATEIADGTLRMLIGKLQCFHVSLFRLDMRQESSIHEALLDKITEHVGLPKYSAQSLDEQRSFLCRELESRRPLIPLDVVLDDVERDTLSCFSLLRRTNAFDFHSYVISMTRSVADILAVELLAKEFGVEGKIWVTPLFETIDDLRNAPKIMDELLQTSWYQKKHEKEVQVMIGYSDSTKSGGKLASAWSVFKAQSEIIQVCKKHGFAVRFFHGRGGTIGRGGGPIRDAIAAQPPGSVPGVIRVTEQGEMIQSKFGLSGIAFRTLELYLMATLEKTLEDEKEVPLPWWDAMEKAAQLSYGAYREIISEGSDFLKYFNAITPISELSYLNIGSRPARRRQTGSLDSLRAIPWIFSWTQVRLLAPSWVGLGTGLGQLIDEGQLPELRQMYQEWGFFRVTIDLIEMVLAKVDTRVALAYERKLVPPDLRAEGEKLQTLLMQTIKVILDITGRRQVLEENLQLRKSIELRNPYIDPINFIQAEALKRMRSESEPPLGDLNCFLSAVNGISAGMKNTG